MYLVSDQFLHYLRKLQQNCVFSRSGPDLVATGNILEQQNRTVDDFINYLSRAPWTLEECDVHPVVVAEMSKDEWIASYVGVGTCFAVCWSFIALQRMLPTSRFSLSVKFWRTKVAFFFCPWFWLFIWILFVQSGRKQFFHALTSISIKVFAAQSTSYLVIHKSFSQGYKKSLPLDVGTRSFVVS